MRGKRNLRWWERKKKYRPCVYSWAMCCRNGAAVFFDNAVATHFAGLLKKPKRSEILAVARKKDARFKTYSDDEQAFAIKFTHMWNFAEVVDWIGANINCKWSIRYQQAIILSFSDLEDATLCRLRF